MYKKQEQLTDQLLKDIAQKKLVQEQIQKMNEHLEQNVAERTKQLTASNESLKVEIAERKQAEQRQAELVEEVEKVNQELKEFVYVASHDLREPLRKIASFGNLLKKSLEGKLNTDDSENLNLMIDGADRMTKMIDGLLAYSRIGNKGVSVENIDLNETVRQLEQIELAVLLESTGAEIQISEHLSEVKANSVQIRQLLQNLIANGIKYHRDGVRPRIVISGKPAENDMVRVEIVDNGIGIEKKYYDEIFIMFHRLHSRRKYEGTGIGLSVCKKIVERYGGQIGVESVCGEGSTFWFTLPAAIKSVVEKKAVVSV